MNRPRTKTEIKLLQIRQGISDALEAMEHKTVVSLELYRRLIAQKWVIEELLLDYQSRCLKKSLRIWR